MADLISSLPDDIICYILFFLPSQQVVATSVLSKRWNLLWRFVPSLDFDTFKEYFLSRNEENTYNTFYSSVCSFLVGRGDQPLYRIRLRCYSSIAESMQTLIQTAVSGNGRVQILNLNCDFGIVIPMFSFKTLVSLKLEYIFVEHISFFDLPLLKILHLKHVSPIEDDLSQLLSGCPNLEELNVKDLGCETTEKFIKLPKLVRVRMDEPFLPLEIFKDVEVLKFDWVMLVRFITFQFEREYVFFICFDIISFFLHIFPFPPNLNFDFHNLVQLQLIVDLDWLVVLKTLNHCPKLQTLVISMEKSRVRYYQILNLYEEDVWPYPQTVPVCISSHLKTCRLKYYNGSKDEFHFVRYILENAKYLRTMKIRPLWQENDMKRELSSCMKKRSDTCTLSFEITPIREVEAAKRTLDILKQFSR